MRRIAFVAVAAFLVGCSNEPTAPGTDDQVTAFATQAEGTVLTAAGGYDADLYELRLFHGLPGMWRQGRSHSPAAHARALP